MDNKIHWRLILGVVLVGISGGLVWQWFQSGTLGAGIAGIAIMLIGAWQIFPNPPKIAMKSPPTEPVTH